MSKITREHAKDGGHGKAAARASVLPASPAFKSPFDVLKPDFKRDELASTQTLTPQGSIKVEFPPGRRKNNISSTRSKKAQAPKFNHLGDQAAFVEPEQMAALPRRRYGSTKDK